MCFVVYFGGFVGMTLMSCNECLPSEQVVRGFTELSVVHSYTK